MVPDARGCVRPRRNTAADGFSRSARPHCSPHSAACMVWRSCRTSIVWCAFLLLRGLPLRTSGNYSGPYQALPWRKNCGSCHLPWNLVFDDSSFIVNDCQIFVHRPQTQCWYGSHELFRTFSTGLLMVFGDRLEGPFERPGKGHPRRACRAGEVAAKGSREWIHPVRARGCW